MDEKPVILEGGNMNQPLLSKGLVYKDASAQSQTIHMLLNHVRSKGIDWVPQSFGINGGKHVLSYIKGYVPDGTPSWLWKEDLLVDIAHRLREWHDGTRDFYFSEAKWYLNPEEKGEVICHCDFAPYNCVFQDEKFKGLIDFDVCAPASQLWDMAYTAYRFIPLVPQSAGNHQEDNTPFGLEDTWKRLDLFLRSYASGDISQLYTKSELLKKTVKRLKALADWSENYARETGKKEIMGHSIMYRDHADWLQKVMIGIA